MMEVKHSPASQMEFRSTTNGLPENEVEDLDTIFDNDVGKSLTPPSDESNSSAPILNGIVKHSEELPSTENLDGMEIDLLKDETESNDKTKVAAASTEQNKENEEAEGVSKSDIDLFELGLEEESTEKVEEFKDAARDTGDDLDTLLSKINDLVEDCMETKAAGAAAGNEDEIVEIPDDDVDDLSVSDAALETTEKSSLEMEVEEDIKGEEVTEAKVEAKAQAETEGELKEVFATKATEAIIEKAASLSGEEAALDQMEVDADLSDDIVCLDSPLPEERQVDEDELMIGKEEVVTSDSTEKPAAEEEKVSQKEEESSKMEEEVAVEKSVEPLEKAAEERPKVIEDDEIYLIEDDDDNDDSAEVAAKDSDPTEKKNEIAEESEDGELKAEKDIESALDEICRTPEDEHTSLAASEDKPSAEDDDDDDDEIVCLDDSDKEDELKEDEIQKTSTVKEVLVEKEEDKNDEKEEDVCMKVVETVDQNTETTVEMDNIKDKVSETTEKVKETSDNVVVDEQSRKSVEAKVVEEEIVSVEEIFAKPSEDIEKVVETSIEEIPTKPVEEILPKAVNEVKEKQEEEVAETSVEEAVEKPVEKTIDGAVLETAVEAVVAKTKTALEEQAATEPSEAEKPATEAVEHVEQSAKPVPEDVCSKADAKEAGKPDDKPVTEPEKPSNMVLDDDIVILDDDEEEEEATSPAVSEPKESTVDSDKKSPPSSSNDEEKKIEELTNSENLTSMAKSSTILSDNSDNARDGVEEKQDNEEANETVKENIPVPSESNSCSNSSNLLKETNPEERVNREEQSEQPPAKRIRLSQDEEASSRHSTVSMDDTKSNTVDEDEVMEIKTDEDSKSLKRVHSSESIVSDFKKPKTEEDAVKAVGVEVAVAQEEPVKKKEVEVKPLALYPPPMLDAPAINLSLDFLKRFKKSIHKMTKCDLEELVLQKIVEAIVHKSEFSEMRELIEKQEKVISSHRTKITELNKQFRDLEMVHNRVLKDLETKNSQFIMPVKITRAVGLQVFFPNKKYDQPLVPHSPVPTQTSPRSSSSLSNSTSSSTNTNSMPERSSTPVTPTNTPTSSNSVNTQVTGSSNVQAQVQRRGCVQKLTPMRPDTPRNSPLNRGGLNLSQQSVVAAAKEAVGAHNAKTFNRAMPLKGRPPMAAVVGRSPVGVNSPPAALVQTPPLAASIVAAPKQSSIPPGIATKKPTVVKGGTSVLLGSTRYQANQPKNYLSDPQATAQPLPPAATIVTPPVPPCLTSTPKPVNKSVIDLTDEDDAVQTPTPSAVNNPRTTTAMPAQTPPSGAAAVNRGPYKVSVIPQQLLQQPKPNPPKQTALRPPVPIAPKPNGMAISVRTGPPHPSRYRHPAPLPNQPIHSTNPAWKLPPTRPTIRISNLDSGIVISWTIEDAAKEKYAESTSYQIYAYQETSGPPLVESWRHVGDVKAMLLPMAVTLTQFQEGQRYYFAVRAVDAHNRCGPFSFAKTWS